jgi:hypothetical protein
MKKEKFQKRPATTAGRFYFYVTIYLMTIAPQRRDRHRSSLGPQPWALSPG